jgi:hypothetical protein
MSVSGISDGFARAWTRSGTNFSTSRVPAAMQADLDRLAVEAQR